MSDDGFTPKFRNDDPPDEDFNDAEPEDQPEDQPSNSALLPWFKRAELAKAKSFKEVYGPRPQFVNLRDHDEFNGVVVAVCTVKFATGEYGEYVFLGCILVEENPQKPVVIMTGAADIVGRVGQAMQLINDGTPLIGVLHHVGRAWVLD